MPSAQILLADLPPMLEGIVVQLLESRPHVRTVRGSAGEGLVAAARSCGARLVVVARQDPGNLTTVDECFAGAAGLSVLAFNRDATGGCLYALTLATERLDDISAADMLRAVDLAVGPADEQAR